MEIEVLHDETLKEGSFFVKEKGKRVAELSYRKISKDLISADHTEVNEEMQGKGVAQAMYHELIRTARQRGWKIKPQCPFVRKMMKKDPEVHDIMEG
ncbi:MAG: N-acetyltransferase [Bacteroidota bacterium]|nr:N-acetyltransferase [Bacteroidota bacterium]MDX5428622.1 N-acetyltransferase [Bacteroidota bacterium]MDX5448577.1 N-acetyltransferase [Bacteroidota bacterium]MDX5506363.1 N-acetyltransferase [Bacteroidota bacterium]